jgi:hypothetical protein
MGYEIELTWRMPSISSAPESHYLNTFVWSYGNKYYKTLIHYTAIFKLILFKNKKKHYSSEGCTYSLQQVLISQFLLTG